MAVYVVLLLLGLELSYVYPLAVITAGGYILEVARMRRCGLTLFTLPATHPPVLIADYVRWNAPRVLTWPQ